MAFKTLLPNQHLPSHILYGHSCCCLCDKENKIKELEEKIKKLEEKILNGS